MRAYWRVSPAFWNDEKVAAWNDDTRLLALYLLTCPHRTTEGLFRLPRGYIQEDLGWSPQRLGKPFAELLREGFIEYDEDTKVCLIVNALEYQAPENGNQVTSALRELDLLPDTPLLQRFLTVAETHCERLAERLPERFRKPLPEGFGKPPAPAPAPTPTPKPSPSPATDEEFSTFWTLYPKKVGKGDARKAYKNARKRADAATIYAGLEAQAFLMAQKEKQYIPNPSTWLNQDRWEDVEEVTKPETNGKGRANRIAKALEMYPTMGDDAQAFCNADEWEDVMKQVTT